MFIFWRQAGPARAQLWAAAFAILPLHGLQMLSSFTQLCVLLLVFIFFSPTYTCRSISLPTLLHAVVPALAGAALRVLTGLSRDHEGNRPSANTGEQNLSSAGSRGDAIGDCSCWASIRGGSSESPEIGQSAESSARRAGLHSRCLCSRDWRRARSSPHGDFHQRRCCRTRWAPAGTGLSRWAVRWRSEPRDSRTVW